MKQLFTLVSFIIAGLCYNNIYAQCSPGQSEIHIHILSDNYPSETSWDLQDGNGNIILSGAFGNIPVNQVTTYDTTLCITSDSCNTFHLHDAAGDGICCGYGIGNYQIEIDGLVVASGGQYGSDHYDVFNCPPGASCSGAFPVTNNNSFQTPFNSTWYSFTPDTSGIYTISTCDSTAVTCNTVIWIYDHCSGLLWDNTNAGTVAYNDDACGTQAEVGVGLTAGITYYIRIGSVLGTCDGFIDWNISGPAPVYGCTDPTACNYNPLATISDGSCTLPGDPNCGPDLHVLQDELISSMNADTYTADNCSVVEHCLAGYGNRRIIRFTTHIQNIGQVPYYIGNPTTNPDQFTFNNCHGHAHYEGYAEYVLYKEDGTILPIGFKNGFCVLDLECWNGGQGQFGCGNMGISPGCGDYYSSGLTCQWIDITDVDTGNYVLVVRVNWDQSPDALGHVEMDYDNNWAQVCIHISETGGVKNYTVNPDCNPYVDCAGQIYGSAQPDCEGTCNGSKVRGDLDNNSMRNLFDINAYMSGIVNNNLAATTCNDLNADGLITVYDAALLNDCTLFGSNYPLSGGGYHNYCNFPTGIYNFIDTMSFTIGEVNYDDQYVDILVKNPNHDLNAYEFDMAGLTIQNVVSLADPADYAQAYPQGQVGGTRVACYSAVDSSLNKSTTYQPLCRIYYTSIADTVCINHIIDVVNNHDEQAFGQTENACEVLFDYVSGIEAVQNIDVIPNPTSNNIHVRFNLPTAEPFALNITNALGQVVYTQQRDGSLLYNENINLDFLPAGTYMLKVNGTSVNASKKIVVIR